MVKKFHTNPYTSAKYLAFMGFSVPENDLLAAGIVCADEAIKLIPAAPYGYFVKGGALEIGRASTKAVVVSCILILFADYLLSALLLPT